MAINVSHQSIRTGNNITALVPNHPDESFGHQSLSSAIKSEATDLSKMQFRQQMLALANKTSFKYDALPNNIAQIVCRPMVLRSSHLKF